jgi:hypothetical protein
VVCIHNIQDLSAPRAVRTTYSSGDQAFGGAFASTSGSASYFSLSGSRIRYRERFMRLWVLWQLERNPGMFPAGKSLGASPEHKFLFSFVSVASAAADGGE